MCNKTGFGGGAAAGMAVGDGVAQAGIMVASWRHGAFGVPAGVAYSPLCEAACALPQYLSP